LPLPLKRAVPRPIKKAIRNALLRRDLYADLKEFKRQKEELDDENFVFGPLEMHLMEKYESGGTTNGQYFHQDLLVARRIFENNPRLHIDVGSRIDGFVAHVASFREIKVIDIRPLQDNVKNMIFIQQDFMSEIPRSIFESCDSASCLHAAEHFGLGRYGDPINYNGHLIGMENLYKILKADGTLYFSVPMGEPQRVLFHGARIFSLKYLMGYFNEKYRLTSFSYVDDLGDLHENVSLTERSIDNSFDCKTGCGIFELKKCM
jgi:hypothetical protein